MAMPGGQGQENARPVGSMGPPPTSSKSSKGRTVVGLIVAGLIVLVVIAALNRPTSNAPSSPTHSPAPTRTGTPPPTAGHTVGEKVRVGDSQFVTLSDAEYSSSGYSEFAEPEGDNVVYAFLLEFEGVDPDGSSYNPFYFSMFADGFEYNFTAFGKDPALGSGSELRPGQVVRGWMSFEAPKVDTVELVYEPVFGLEGSVIWTVPID